jgi:hypothetical protein
MLKQIFTCINIKNKSLINVEQKIFILQLKFFYGYGF